MELEKLDNILEALLFVSGEGLKIDDIMEHLELQRKEVNDAIKNLKKKYSEKSGIHIVTYNNKVQLCSNPDYTNEVAAVLNPVKEKELTNSTLETIAIIAYKQPVTRLEIENIRGVNSDYAVQMLLKHNLIEVVGRKDVIGKPLLFGTTDQFLKRFRIENLEQLPDYSTLIEQIRVIEGAQVQSSASLYNEFEIADSESEEVPEFLHGEEVQKFDADN